MTKKDILDVFEEYSRHKNKVGEIHLRLRSVIDAITASAHGSNLKIEGSTHDKTFGNFHIETKERDPVHNAGAKLDIGIYSEGRIELHGRWYEGEDVYSGEGDVITIYFGVDENSASIAARVVGGICNLSNAGEIFDTFRQFMEADTAEKENNHDTI